MGEPEERHQWQGHSGKVRLLGFVNHGRMENYTDEVQLGQQTASTPDVALMRRASSRAGFAINVEQKLASSVRSDCICSSKGNSHALS